MSAPDPFRGPRRRRAALFLFFFLIVPVPMAVFGGRVPTARVCELAVLCVLVAVREGAGGPVGAMTLLFSAQALAYSLLCWLAALVFGRFAWRPQRRAAAVVLMLLCGAAVVAALCFDVYVTPFGRAPRGNLWEALT